MPDSPDILNIKQELAQTSLKKSLNLFTNPLGSVTRQNVKDASNKVTKSSLEKNVKDKNSLSDLALGIAEGSYSSAKGMVIGTADFLFGVSSKAENQLAKYGSSNELSTAHSVLHGAEGVAQSISLIYHDPHIITKAAQKLENTILHGSNLQRGRVIGQAAVFIGSLGLGAGGLGKAGEVAGDLRELDVASQGVKAVSDASRALADVNTAFSKASDFLASTGKLDTGISGLASAAGKSVLSDGMRMDVGSLLPVTDRTAFLSDLVKSSTGIVESNSGSILDASKFVGSAIDKGVAHSAGVLEDKAVVPSSFQGIDLSTGIGSKTVAEPTNLENVVNAFEPPAAALKVSDTIIGVGKQPVNLETTLENDAKTLGGQISTSTPSVDVVSSLRPPVSIDSVTTPVKPVASDIQDIAINEVMQPGLGSSPMLAKLDASIVVNSDAGLGLAKPLTTDAPVIANPDLAQTAVRPVNPNPVVTPDAAVVSKLDPALGGVRPENLVNPEVPVLNDPDVSVARSSDAPVAGNADATLGAGRPVDINPVTASDVPVTGSTDPGLGAARPVNPVNPEVQVLNDPALSDPALGTAKPINSNAVTASDAPVAGNPDPVQAVARPVNPEVPGLNDPALEAARPVNPKPVVTSDAPAVSTPDPALAGRPADINPVTASDLPVSGDPDAGLGAGRPVNPINPEVPVLNDPALAGRPADINPVTASDLPVSGDPDAGLGAGRPVNPVNPEVPVLNDSALAADRPVDIKPVTASDLPVSGNPDAALGAARPVNPEVPVLNDPALAARPADINPVTASDLPVSGNPDAALGDSVLRNSALAANRPVDVIPVTPSDVSVAGLTGSPEAALAQANPETVMAKIGPNTVSTSAQAPSLQGQNIQAATNSTAPSVTPFMGQGQTLDSAVDRIASPETLNAQAIDPALANSVPQPIQKIFSQQLDAAKENLAKILDQKNTYDQGLVIANLKASADSLAMIPLNDPALSEAVNQFKLAVNKISTIADILKDPYVSRSSVADLYKMADSGNDLASQKLALYFRSDSSAPAVADQGLRTAFEAPAENQILNRSIANIESRSIISAFKHSAMALGGGVLIGADLNNLLNDIVQKNNNDFLNKTVLDSSVNDLKNDNSEKSPSQDSAIPAKVSQAPVSLFSESSNDVTLNLNDRFDPSFGVDKPVLSRQEIEANYLFGDDPQGLWKLKNLVTYGTVWGQFQLFKAPDEKPEDDNKPTVFQFNPINVNRPLNFNDFYRIAQTKFPQNKTKFLSTSSMGLSEQTKYSSMLETSWKNIKLSSAASYGSVNSKRSAVDYKFNKVLPNLHKSAIFSLNGGNTSQSGKQASVVNLTAAVASSQNNQND